MNVRDPGLQQERTTLAWRRTGWSMVLLGFLCMRGGYYHNNALYVIASLLLLGSGFAIFCGWGRGQYYLICLLIMLTSMLLALIFLTEIASKVN